LEIENMPTMTKALGEFLLAGEADGLAPTTLDWYGYLLRPMIQQLGEELPTTHALRQYVVTIRQTYKDHTTSGHIRALHRFFAWNAEEYGVINPMKGIKRMKAPAAEVRSIAPEDFVKMFNNAGENDIGIRNRAIMAFLADTGVRLGGIAGLTLEALDISMRRAWVIEKGRKKRIVVFTFYTARLLELWLAVRPEGSRTVFTTLDTGTGLTTHGIQEIFKRLKKKLGIQGHASPHAFRHGFAKGYLSNGGELATLAKLMGHNDIQTTMDHYAIFSHDELANLHEKYSPLRALLNKNDNAQIGVKGQK
jgi:integrase/recombinase XerD